MTLKAKKITRVEVGTLNSVIDDIYKHINRLDGSVSSVISGSGKSGAVDGEASGPLWSSGSPIYQHEDKSVAIINGKYLFFTTDPSFPAKPDGTRVVDVPLTRPGINYKFAIGGPSGIMACRGIAFWTNGDEWIKVGSEEGVTNNQDWIAKGGPGATQLGIRISPCYKIQSPPQRVSRISKKISTVIPFTTDPAGTEEGSGSSAGEPMWLSRFKGEGTTELQRFYYYPTHAVNMECSHDWGESVSVHGTANFQRFYTPCAYLARVTNDIKYRNYPTRTGTAPNFYYGVYNQSHGFVHDLYSNGAAFDQCSLYSVAQLEYDAVPSTGEGIDADKYTCDMSTVTYGGQLNGTAPMHYSFAEGIVYIENTGCWFPFTSGTTLPHVGDVLVEAVSAGVSGTKVTVLEVHLDSGKSWDGAGTGYIRIKAPIEGKAGGADTPAGRTTYWSSGVSLYNVGNISTPANFDKQWDTPDPDELCCVAGSVVRSNGTAHHHKVRMKDLVGGGYDGVSGKGNGLTTWTARGFWANIQQKTGYDDFYGQEAFKVSGKWMWGFHGDHTGNNPSPQARFMYAGINFADSAFDTTSAGIRLPVGDANGMGGSMIAWTENGVVATNPDDNGNICYITCAGELGSGVLTFRDSANETPVPLTDVINGYWTISESLLIPTGDAATAKIDITAQDDTDLRIGSFTNGHSIIFSQTGTTDAIYTTNAGSATAVMALKVNDAYPLTLASTAALGLTIPATFKLFFDGVSGVGGNTYIAESGADTLDVYAGGSKSMTFLSTGPQLGGALDCNGHDIELDSGDNLSFNGASGDMYIRDSGSDYMQFGIGASGIVFGLSHNGGDAFSYSAKDFCVASGAKIRLDGAGVTGDTYIYQPSANLISLFAGGVNTMTIGSTSALGVVLNYDVTDRGTRLYFDGASGVGGDTYIHASVYDVLQVTCGGLLLWQFAEAAADSFNYSPYDISMASGAKIRLDGAGVSGDTHIAEGTGGDVNKILFTAGGTNSVIITSATCSVDQLTVQSGGQVRFLDGAADGSVEGDFWYDWAAEKLKFRTSSGIETVTST